MLVPEQTREALERNFCGFCFVNCSVLAALFGYEHDEKLILLMAR